MRIDSFFAELKVKNIRVFLENGKVKIDAEERFLTDDFLQKLKSYKTQIIEFLSKPTVLDLDQTTIDNINARCKEWDQAGRNIIPIIWSKASLF